MKSATVINSKAVAATVTNVTAKTVLKTAKGWIMDQDEGGLSSSDNFVRKVQCKLRYDESSTMHHASNGL